MAGKTSYAELLLDPRWQKKRLEVMGAAGFVCEHCGDDQETLHVHHKAYRRGAKPWEYETHELMCLCHRCHGIWHEQKDAIDFAIGRMSFDDLARLAGYALAIPRGNWGIRLNAEGRVLGIADFSKVPTEAVREASFNFDGVDCINSFDLPLVEATKKRSKKRG